MMIRCVIQLYRKCRKEVYFRLLLAELEGADSVMDVIALIKKALSRYRKGDLTTEQLAEIKKLAFQQGRTTLSDTVETKVDHFFALLGQVFRGGEKHD